MNDPSRILIHVGPAVLAGQRECSAQVANEGHHQRLSVVSREAVEDSVIAFRKETKQ